MIVKILMPSVKTKVNENVNYGLRSNNKTYSLDITRNIIVQKLFESTDCNLFLGNINIDPDEGQAIKFLRQSQENQYFERKK